jgi:hypothetical protein
MYDTFSELLHDRRSVRLVDVRIGDIAGTVAAVESAIAWTMP